MSVHRLRNRLAASVLAAFFLAGGSLSASAADAPSNWWFDAYGMGSIQAEGWTGKGVKIAVIDGNINPDLPAFAGRNLTVDPRSLCTDHSQPTTTEATGDSIHGTTLVAQIIGTGDGPGAIRGMAPEANVTFFSLGTSNGEPCTASEFGDSLSPVALGIQRAVDAGAEIVTTSVTTNPGSGDADVIANAVAKGVVVIAATVNPKTRADAGRGISGFRGVAAASAVDQAGALQKSDDGSPFALSWTTLVAPGIDLPTVGDSDDSWTRAQTASGSSFAAPLVAGMLALVKQKYPDATGNQLLQSVIHNTGKDDHDLAYDAASGFGYGLAWPAHLLRESPLQYPDENPLLATDEPRPTDRQIEDARQRGSTYPPLTSADASEGAAAPRTGDTAPQDRPTGASWIPLTFVIAALAVTVVVGAIITLVVVMRTRRTRAGASR